MNLNRGQTNNLNNEVPLIASDVKNLRVMQHSVSSITAYCNASDTKSIFSLGELPNNFSPPSFEQAV